MVQEQIKTTAAEQAAVSARMRQAQDRLRQETQISSGRKVKGGLVNGLMIASFVIVIGLLAVIIGYICYRGLPKITWQLLSTQPSHLKRTVGILPNILNTIYIILITLMIVLPLGVGTAIYLTEYATNAKLVRIIEFTTETLSGIPSIIYGLAGLLIFVQALHCGTSILAGALTLVIMTLPTIIRSTQESLKTVPDSYREGSLALGSGKWHMIRTVVLPSSIDGIVTGCILAIGRIVGEAAALLFTAGMANNIMNFGQAFLPNNAGSTLTVALYMYAMEQGDFDTAFAIAAILLILTFIINFAAKQVARKLRKNTAAD